MLRWLKRIGLVIAGLVGLVVLFVAFAYAMAAVRMAKTYDVPGQPVAASAGAGALERGRHLTVAVAKCVTCHGDDLGGQVMEDDPAFGRLVASNLTAGRGGIASSYTDADWERAIRHGVGRDGKSLVFMPAEAFWALSDRDLADLLAHVKSVPPVDRVLPPVRVGPVARMISLIGSFPLLPARLVDHEAERRPPPAGVSLAYGDYLATIGGCKGCHGPTLAGDGAPGVPDITRGRLGSWTEADFFRSLRSGVRPDGSAISQDMPWIYAGKMTDEEIRAVWTYLRSLTPRAERAS